MMLASIGESIKKYDKKLGKVNAAYGEEQKKIRGEKQLGQVVVSPKPIMKTVQRELIKAEDRRRALLRLKAVFRRTWRQSENLQGLEDYLPFVELPEFPKCLGRWWRELWPVIKKNNPVSWRSCERVNFRREEYVINLGGRLTVKNFVTPCIRFPCCEAAGYFDTLKYLRCSKRRASSCLCKKRHRYEQEGK